MSMLLFSHSSQAARCFLDHGKKCLPESHRGEEVGVKPRPAVCMHRSRSRASDCLSRSSVFVREVVLPLVS